MNDDELRTIALKRLKARADFFSYLWVWLFVSVLLTAIWAIAGPHHYFWPAWAIAGMGVGAFFKAGSLYVRKDVTEADVAAEVERMSRRG